MNPSITWNLAKMDKQNSISNSIKPNSNPIKAMSNPIKVSSN